MKELEDSQENLPQIKQKERENQKKLFLKKENERAVQKVQYLNASSKEKEQRKWNDSIQNIMNKYFPE